MKRILTLLVVLLALFARTSSAQPVYDAFSACMASRAATMNNATFEDGAYCNYVTRPGVARPVGVPMARPYGRGYVPPPIYSYDYGYGMGWYDHCNSYMPLQSQNPECHVAEIKFRIQGSGLNNVTVRVDGDNLGLVDKYSHKATSGLRLAGEHRYEVELEWVVNKDVTKTVIYYINPLTIRMQDGAYWYPVYKDLFENAPYGRTVTPKRETIDGRDYIKKGGGN